MLRTRVACKVAAGAHHTLVLLGDGSVWASGDNQDGQLAIEPRNWSSGGAFVSSIQGYSVVSVAAGDNHSLFLTSGGSVLSCGNNSMGQLAQGQGHKCAHRPRSIKVDWRRGDSEHSFVMIAAGGDCGAAVTDSGRVYTWGYSEKGALGRKLVRKPADAKAGKALPQPSAGVVESLCKLGVKAHSVATCSTRTLILDEQGAVYATGPVDHPVSQLELPGGQPAKQIAVGGDGRSAFVMEDGTLFTSNSATDPIRGVQIEEPVMEVGCGADNSLAITVHGVIVAFGQDESEVMVMPGNTYHGELKHEAVDVYSQVRMGNGELHSLDGSVYSGQFSQNKPHGHGQLTTANGDHFIGTWRNGQRVSTKATFADGTSYSGPFNGYQPHGFGIWEDPCDDSYVGEFIDGKFNGYGTHTCVKQGDSYDGEMVDGKKHGYGICTWTYEDGEGVQRKYQGQWEHNVIQGYGVMAWSDVGTYAGFFEDCQRSGHGTMQWKFGERAGCFYDGQWEKDKMHGHGMYIGEDGEVYEGGFYANERYGPGCLADTDGKLHTVEYNDLHEEVVRTTHNSAIGHLEKLQVELAAHEQSIEDAKKHEQECNANLAICAADLEKAEEHKNMDDVEFARTQEQHQRCERTLDVVGKQVSTAASARSTNLLQKQGQLETFTLANMDPEANKLHEEIRELQAKAADANSHEQSKLTSAQAEFDAAVSAFGFARQRSNTSKSALKTATLDHNFAHKKLLAAKAATKRFTELRTRVQASIRIAEHWREQEEWELKAKIAERAEKTAVEQLVETTERFKKTQKDVHVRNKAVTAREFRVRGAQEKLDTATREAEEAEADAEEKHQRSIIEMSQANEQAYIHARAVQTERQEIKVQREEEKDAALLKLERTQKAKNKIESVSATAEGRMNAVQTVVEKHRSTQQQAKDAMHREQQAELAARAELEALEAVELTEVVQVAQPQHATHTQTQAKVSGWDVFKKMNKFVSAAKSAVKNDPHKMPPMMQRDALSEVCREEIKQMHLSLEEPDLDAAQKQLEQRWNLKYKYKYMYKYTAREKANATSTHACAMLGSVSDPMDPVVMNSPKTPAKEPESIPPPVSPDALSEDAEIEFAVSSAEISTEQVDEVYKQAQRQANRLSREFNLVPLSRQAERLVLKPIVKHRRCLICHCAPRASIDANHCADMSLKAGPS